MKPNPFAKAAAETLGLTPRQAQIMELVVMDLQDKEIGDKLECSRFTVRAHLTCTFERLRVTSRAGAAYAWGKAIAHLTAGVLIAEPKEPGKVTAQ